MLTAKIAVSYWCGRGDSNPYDLAIASPSSWCVCQFRHFRDHCHTENWSVSEIGELVNSKSSSSSTNSPTYQFTNSLTSRITLVSSVPPARVNLPVPVPAQASIPLAPALPAKTARLRVGAAAPLR
jgi:hypothetical protein